MKTYFYKATILINNEVKVIINEDSKPTKLSAEKELFDWKYIMDEWKVNHKTISFASKKDESNVLDYINKNEISQCNFENIGIEVDCIEIKQICKLECEKSLSKKCICPTYAYFKEPNLKNESEYIIVDGKKVSLKIWNEFLDWNEKNPINFNQ